MTSFSPSPKLVESATPPAAGKFSHSSISETKVTKNGRSYTNLSSIQRLGRLVKAITMLLLNFLGIRRSEENASKISQWWNEFKKGKKFNVKESSGDTLPLNLRNKDRDRLNKTDIQTIKVANDVKSPLTEKQESPPVATQPLLREEPLPEVIHEEESNGKSAHSDSGADHQEPELKKGEIINEEIPAQVIVADETERQKLDKRKEPIELKIKSKERREEPLHIETQPLAQEEQLPKVIHEEESNERSTSSESEADHQEPELEKGMVVNEDIPVQVMVSEEQEIDKVEQRDIELKIKPKGQESSVEMQEDSSAKETFETPTEAVALNEDTTLVAKSEVEITKAEKINTIIGVIHNENVKNWLIIAETNPLLCQTSLYQNLKIISDILSHKEKLIDEELIIEYTANEEKILAIKNTSAEHLDKLIQQQEDEFVFNTLKANELKIDETVKLLKDGKGKFKTNLQALLNLLSITSPISSPSSSFLLEKEQSLGSSVQVDESALEVTLKHLDPANAFADFKNQINEETNRPAKDALIAFTEILKAGATEKNIKQRLVDYNDAERAIQQAIIDLAKPLEEIAKNPLENQLSTTLDKLNQIFKSLPNTDTKPFLKNLLIQNTQHAATVFFLLEQKSDKTSPTDPLSQKITTTIYHLKTHLGVESKERLNFVINLGKEVLAEPEKAFNQYLDTQGVLQFTPIPPDDSLSVEHFLQTIDQDLDQKTYTAEELLALEAFTLVALYSYIINPQAIINSSFQSIAEILTTIRAKTEIKLNKESIRVKVEELRKNKQNQNFYKLLKEKIEKTPTYPKDFWFDPKAIEKMTMTDPLLRTIGTKIAAPDTQLNEPTQLLYKNDLIGYEIYFYPAESKNEKPKLLLFLTKPSASSTLQGMNHQLGLFGDPLILQSAQEIMSSITSTDVLEGFQQDLKEGNLDIIASGFDNSGATASIVANKLALFYPKTIVKSISAGSTTIVTTEDAYNMNRAENCFSIRLKYVGDANVNRIFSHLIGDFSEDSYHTFPLLVKYNLNILDINKHNKEEYGNVNNFVPAMKNPLILRSLYQEISDHIIYTSTDIDTEAETPLDTSLTDSLLGSSLFDFAVVAPQKHLHIGQLDDLIELGNHIRDNIEQYKDAFLKLDDQKFFTSHKSAQVKEFEKNQENETQEKPKAGFSFFDWFKPKAILAPVVKKSVLTIEEQENTIHALRHTIIDLKNHEVMNLITPEKAIALLIAADTLLINYTKINTNVGKLPQLVDLISELRGLASERLETLYQDKEAREIVSHLLKQEEENLELLANRVLGLNTEYKDLFNEKKDVLGRIDYEDRFLEYLGFKIAVKGQDKLGSESYVSKLYTNYSENYDISLFTPAEPNQKQRIVISCNGEDALGAHQIMAGDFGAGDSAIISRAEKLKALISSQLKEQFNQLNIDAGDVDIVVTGFGSEGAVATALGYSLAKEFEKQGCQVQSVGFGAPRFTTKEGADLIRSQLNFVPIRFLSPADKLFEWKTSTMNDFPLSQNTYYTIPFQFRIVSTFESSHNTNLYGDIQGIKTSLKTAYQMREVAHEKEKLSLLKETQNIAKKATIEQAAIPKRVNLDTRKNFLIDFSQKSVEELKKVEPGKLIRIMKYCIDLSTSDAITEKDQELIRHFFSKFIEAIKNEDINENHSIQNSFYKKMVDHGYKPNQLFSGKWKIQQIISKNLEDAMEAVKQADNSLDAKTKDELILRRNYYRGILAGDLNGNRYKPAGGGVNGAVFFRHLESGLKKPIALLSDETIYQPFLGVFKPHPETVSEFKGWFDATQWGERLKAVAGMDSHLNKKDPNKRVNNEVFAYELFHTFGFKSYVGFPTTLKFINKNDAENRPASFCTFVPGLDIVALHVKEVSKKEAKSNILNSKKRLYSDQELHIWQMSKIFDFLTGNMDGHEGNAFVKVDQQGKIVGAVNFDYDKAFAIDSPKNIGNQYKWANLRISKQNLTDATKDALAKMFTGYDAEEKIQAFLATARGDIANKQNFTEEQEALLKKRIEVLKKIVTGEIKQLSELQNHK